MVPIDDRYKEELYHYFISNLNDSFKTAEIEDQLKYAFDFAFKAHSGQRRKTTGEPFIIHPVSVALIVANEIGLGVLSVVAALLHDVVEDTDYTVESIVERFGRNVADIVEGVTKITNVYNAKENSQAATFRKMLLAIPHNPRVIFIKLADRLHNMRTMNGMPEKTIRTKTGENLFVYVPIAYQLGLYDLKNEIEDRSFMYSQPSRYQDVQKMVSRERLTRDPLVADFKKDLMRVLVDTSLTCKIVTESKSYHYVSLALMEGRPIEEIRYEAVRVVFQVCESHVGNRECEAREYAELYETIIRKFSEREGYKRDFVSNPKSNGFRAIIFEVYYKGYWIEVQLLNEDDDMVSHKGYSSRRPTREGVPTFTKKVGELLSSAQPAEELLRRLHNITTADERTILIFSSKGDIYQLPKDSTVVDFAYAVHTDIGNHCIGANVGDKFVPLDYKLNTADHVTVYTSASARPQHSWLHLVRTDKAKNKITQYFTRTSTNAHSVSEGEKMFNNYLSTQTPRILPDPVIIKELIKHYHLLHGDDLYKRISSHEIEMEDVYQVASDIRRLIRENKDNSADNKGTNAQSSGSAKNTGPVIDCKIPLRIEKGMQFVAPDCCHAICGDDAIVFKDDDNILYIHRRDCMYAHGYVTINSREVTRVEWGDGIEPLLAVLRIQGIDRQGLVRDLSVLIDSWRINIQSLEIGAHDRIFTGTVKLHVKNTAVLEKLESQLVQIPHIVSVQRLGPNSSREWLPL